jgi:hypothetical protein
MIANAIAATLAAIPTAPGAIRVVSADGAPVSVELIRPEAAQIVPAAEPAAAPMPNLYQVSPACRNLPYRVVDREGRMVAKRLTDLAGPGGLQLLVDGAEPERLREVLEVEINTFEDEMKLSAKIWEAAGGYSPTIGILGAVMGLIHVMENLSDPSKLGAGIAVAFVATIYGVGLANLVFLPMANKLKAHIGRLVVQREMIVDGLVGIANGDNPRIIENRLKGYSL